MVLAENRSERLVDGNIRPGASGSQLAWRRFRRAMLKPALFSYRKLEPPVALLAISLARARTPRLLRSPNNGIGTELLADREKIEGTGLDSPFERSPVPMGRAHRHDTRAVCALSRRMLQTSDWLAERTGFELSVPSETSRVE
jgi:hypothetical protein